MNTTYLLALDFRGTLDVMLSWPLADQKKLKHLLKHFYQAGFVIVFASHEEERNLRDFCTQHALTEYITAYKSNASAAHAENLFVDFMRTHQEVGHKTEQLNAYCRQFSIPKQQCYFFDDNAELIAHAQANGFVHSSQVGQYNTLLEALAILAKQPPQDSHGSLAHCAQKLLETQETEQSSDNALTIQKFVRVIKDFVIRPILG